MEHELPWRAHVEHVETDAQPGLSKDEMIARAHWARGAFDQRGPGPLRQLARVREQVPDALGGSEENVSCTDFHRSASLSPYFVDTCSAPGASTTEVAPWPSARGARRRHSTRTAVRY